MFQWLRWSDPSSTPQERRLLVKIDWYILSFLCLMFFVNYLDRVNFVNAYVSGMGVALKFKGHEFNNVIIYFTSGFAIGQIPQNILLLKVPGNILFPVNCVIWGGLTMASAAATRVEHLYAIKFFQGMAESSTFTGASYIMGSWYKRDIELGKRLALFASSAQIAAVFSGPLQARIFINLHGRGGLAGWQWLFIICGIITLPIALYGYFFFPGTPETIRASASSWYLTKEERQLAIERLPPRKPTQLTFKSVLRVFGSWEVYLMTLVWIFGGAAESIWTNSLMALWMRSQKIGKISIYTIPQINNYPSGGPAIAVVALLVTAFWSDYTKKRYAINILSATCSIIAASLLISYDHISTGVKMFAFYLGAVAYSGQAANFAWANELAGDDDVKRSVIIATMNTATYACNSAWSLVFFAANLAPKWHKGMIVMLICCPLLILSSLATRLLQLRSQQRMEAEGDTVAPGWNVELGVGEKSEEGSKVDEGETVGVLTVD